MLAQLPVRALLQEFLNTLLQLVPSLLFSIVSMPLKSLTVQNSPRIFSLPFVSLLLVCYSSLNVSSLLLLVEGMDNSVLRGQVVESPAERKSDEEKEEERDEEAQHKEKEKKTSADMRIVVVGGGAAGIELACCFLSRYSKILSAAKLQDGQQQTREKGGKRNRVCVTLVDQHKDIVENMCPKLRKLVKKKLSLLGIQLITGKKAVKVNPDTGEVLFLLECFAPLVRRSKCFPLFLILTLSLSFSTYPLVSLSSHSGVRRRRASPFRLGGLVDRSGCTALSP